MQMLVDAALITKRSAALDYNTDSVNAAGKIWPREIVHSEGGIKAAGKSQGKPYYVLASADAKGTAESAADLFKNCVSSFLPDGSNYSESIADFFRAFAQVLDKSGYDSGACDLAVFAGYNDRVYLAKSGKARLFRFAEDEFYEAKPQMFPHEDSAASYGVSAYSDVKPGEIFVLMSGKVGAYISESLLKAIIKNANGDIKRIVAMIASNAVKNGCDDAVSVIVLKIEADGHVPAEELIAAAGEAEPVDADYKDNGDTEEAESDADDYSASRQTYYVPSDEDVNEETNNTAILNRYKTRNKFSRAAIIDIIIVVAVIGVLLGVLAVKGVFGGPKSGKATKDGVDMSDLFAETDTTKKKNEKESTTAADVTTTARSAVTQRAVTTTRRSSTVTPTTPVVQTDPPATEPPATVPPVTEPPVTEPPVTEPPVTEPPVTEPPVTEPPVTEPPATEPPVTEPPETIDPNIAED